MMVDGLSNGRQPNGVFFNILHASTFSSASKDFLAEFSFLKLFGRRICLGAGYFHARFEKNPIRILSTFDAVCMQFLQYRLFIHLSWRCYAAYLQCICRLMWENTMAKHVRPSYFPTSLCTPKIPRTNHQKVRLLKLHCMNLSANYRQHICTCI